MFLERTLSCLLVQNYCRDEYQLFKSEYRKNNTIYFLCFSIGMIKTVRVNLENVIIQNKLDGKRYVTVLFEEHVEENHMTSVRTLHSGAGSVMETLQQGRSGGGRSLFSKCNTFSLKVQ